MSMNGRVTRRVLTTGTLAAAVAGRGARAAEKTLTVGASVFPDSLLPGISSFQSESLLEQTNEALFSRDDDGNLHPALALTATPMSDTVTRFKLREGVICHDGKEFTSEDVVFTIGYVIDPKTAYGISARIGPVTGAVAVDKYTVDITTKAAFPTLLKGLSFILMQLKRYYDTAGARGLQAHPMGTGPFAFQRWSAGDRYTLTAHKPWWGGVPKVDRLVIREIPDAGTRVASLVSGETDIIEEVPMDLVGQVEASGSAKVDAIVSSAALVLTYDVRVPPFDNPKVREAFDYAVDKEAIFKEILKGRGEVMQGQLLTRATFGFNPAIKPRPFDPAKAKAMLQEAKYDFSTPIPIATQNGKYVSDVDICNAVAGMLTNIGVNATVNVVEGGVFLQMQNAFKSGPIYMVGWYSLGDADFATVWYTKAGRRTTWVNDEYERLFVDARSTNDQAERLAKYHRMEEILFAENPSMYLFGLPSQYGVGTKVSGFRAAGDKCLRVAQTSVG